jgi:glycosyltransferase involved in cell wall biosynthesis
VRVALLSLDFPPHFIGGVSAWSMDMAMALSRAGHTVTVFAKSTGNTADHDTALPFPVHRVTGRSWAKWAGLWMRLATRGQLADCDLVLAASWPLATALGPVPRLAVAFHGSEITMLETAPRSLKRVSKAADVQLPVSQFLADELSRLGCAETPTTVLPMPLDLDVQPAPTRSPSLVCVARPTDRKGIDRAIGIASATGRHLDLVGPSEGPTGTCAHGTLSRADTMAVIARASAIVLTPRTTPNGLGGEGLGLCVLEAAARGVPAIGCATGGVPEAIGPGLILSDPDAPDGDQINAWLNRSPQGVHARNWLHQHHGPAHSLAVLEATVL